jgi:type II secretory pathway component PulJ
MFKKSAGITLVEAVVVTVLASMVFGSAMGIWSYTRKNMSRTVTRQVLQQDATRILTYLQADLKAAKADTFTESDSPPSLEFTRYAVDPDDNTKLSNESTQDIKYVFTKPILRRYVNGNLNKVLSNGVEDIKVSRKELSAEAKEKDPYLQARVLINLEMGKKAKGSTNEEHFVKHTSVVIRDEFYALANKERSDIFEESAKVAEELVKENDSNFFKDELDAESLKNLTDEQLDDLEGTQNSNLDEANLGLKEINKRIAEVESGDGFFNMWWWKNHDAADVETLKKELKKLKCDDKDIPEKDSGERASEKASAIMDKIDDKIDELETKFLKAAYGSDYVDSDTEVESEREKADLQKRAYDMKITDRQIEKALEEMTPEEKTEAEENGTLPKKMIDYYYRTEDEIRQELETSGLVEKGSEEFEDMLESEVEKMEDLKKAYEACNVSFLDDEDVEVDGEKIEKKTITAYDGAKQLRSLAESKMETFKLKELAIDNLVEIDKARKMKKEELGDTQD